MLLYVISAVTADAVFTLVNDDFTLRGATVSFSLIMLHCDIVVVPLIVTVLTHVDDLLTREHAVLKKHFHQLLP